MNDVQSTVDIFVDQEKINFFRVTFLMERMCPLSFGLGSRFNETVSLSRLSVSDEEFLTQICHQYFAEYADAVNHITITKGAYALIDPHNYMRYKYVFCFSGYCCISHTSAPCSDPSQQPNTGSVPCPNHVNADLYSCQDHIGHR